MNSIFLSFSFTLIINHFFTSHVTTIMHLIFISIRKRRRKKIKKNLMIFYQPHRSLIHVLVSDFEEKFIIIIITDVEKNKCILKITTRTWDATQLFLLMIYHTKALFCTVYNYLIDFFVVVQSKFYVLETDIWFNKISFMLFERV